MYGVYIKKLQIPSQDAIFHEIKAWLKILVLISWFLEDMYFSHFLFPIFSRFSYFLWRALKVTQNLHNH